MWVAHEFHVGPTLNPYGLAYVGSILSPLPFPCWAYMGGPCGAHMEQVGSPFGTHMEQCVDVCWAPLRPGLMES